MASGAEHGVTADPVLRADGKTVRGPRHQLVRFGDGVDAVVIKRCLRLRDKCSVHRGV
jgi:hypothetical protein